MKSILLALMFTGIFVSDAHAQRFRGRFLGRRAQPVSFQAGCQCSKGCDCGLDCVCPEQGQCDDDCHCKGVITGATGQTPNFGLDVSKLRPPDAPEEIKLNGWPVTKTKALEVIEGRRPRPGPEPDPEPTPSPDAPKGIPDDAKKARLTIIGPEPDRQRVLADLTKLADPGWVVRDYPPDHWHVAAGFKTDGHPTIYLQAADGKVLHRQDDYAGPGDFQAIRKADPNYKPADDPDVRKTASTNLLIPPVALLGLLGLLGFLAWRSKYRVHS